jgi:hypothetical protein
MFPTRGAHKEVGLGETASFDRILECPGDMLLTDNLLKALRTVFSGKDSVAHGVEL